MGCIVFSRQLLPKLRLFGQAGIENTLNLVEKIESAKRELAYAGPSSTSMYSIPLGLKRMLAVLRQIRYIQSSSEG
jgi:hypothetical protein